MSPIPFTEESREERAPVAGSPRKGCLLPILLIGLLWLAGLALSLIGRDQAGTVIVELEGPWPELVQAGQPARLAGLDSTVPAGARLRAATGTSVTLRVPGGPRLTLRGDADLTNVNHRSFSLNRGRMEVEAEPLQPGRGTEDQPVEGFVVLTPNAGPVRIVPGPTSPDVVLHARRDDLDVTVATGVGLRLEAEGGVEQLHGPGRYRFREGEVLLQAGGSIGSATLAGASRAQLTGVLRTPRGAPAPGAQAALYPLGEDPEQFWPVGGTGIFEAKDISPGTYTLEIRSRDYVTTGISPLVLAPGEGKIVSMTLRKGASILGMAADAESGEGIMDARVVARVHPADDHLLPATELLFHRRLQTTTQHQGLFHLEGLDPAVRYDIRVSARGYVSSGTDGFSPAVPRLLVPLAPAGAIQGVVVAAPGEPAAYAVVRAEAEDGRVFRGMTDITGLYRIGSLPAGTCRLGVRERRRGGREAGGRAVEVGPGTELLGQNLTLTEINLDP